MIFLIRVISIAILAVSALARTHRYQIITREDGTKEILSNQNGTTPSADLKFLAQDLNASLIKSDEPTSSSPIEDLTEIYFPARDYSTTGATSTISIEKESDAPLLNQLNSYTANGWTGHKNTVYANSTKLTIYDDGKDTHVLHNHLVKKGRAENLTEDETTVVELPIDQPDVWDVIERLYDCFHNYSKFGSAVECFKTRVTSIFYSFLDKSLKNVTGKSVGEKSFKHGKKVLKGALLPLMVLLIIKYLVALPVIAAGLITIKTFWLSLLSAGVAAFGAPWKPETHHSIIKRYRPADGLWSQPPWMEAFNKVDNVEPVPGNPDNKYFM